MKILIICTGNTCRSQMAEGFLKTFDDNLEVYSAGTETSGEVNPNAIKAMGEFNIDLKNNFPKSVNQFLDNEFDYIITVCGGAKESCPIFTGNVKHRIHIGFDDPADATGTDEEILNEFRKIRNEILVDFFQFYQTKIK